MSSSLDTDGKKRKVAYFYDDTVGNYFYSKRHPMKPLRIRMAHNLIENYNLLKDMEVVRTYPADPKQIINFHSEDYVKFLTRIVPGMTQEDPGFIESEEFNIPGKSNDCPAFEGVFDFSRISAGGSIGAAVKLCKGDVDIAINWAGGLHHAKKCSSFCYVNDIVLGILELLKKFKRVLYVDIDIHHGDGVEEAFYHTDRVMTVSFHHFARDFFPGTGRITSVGVGEGKNYSLNVPLNQGIDDDSFGDLFRSIIGEVNQRYQPEVIVLQSGADSLSGDALGNFNLTLVGHAQCLVFLKSLNVPIMLLGGGGYTMRNVARCWCYETAVAIGVEIDEKLPLNAFSKYIGSDLHIKPGSHPNLNSKRKLETLRNKVLKQLSKIAGAPSVQNQDTPALTEFPDEPEEPMEPIEKGRASIWNNVDIDYDEYERDQAPCS